MHGKLKYQAITFDDVLLEPRCSNVLPNQVEPLHQMCDPFFINRHTVHGWSVL